MSKISIQFQKMVVDSQEAGSNDEHQISRVHFVVSWPNGGKTPAYCDVKLPVGGKYETDELEVSKPHGLKGAYNYEQLSKAVDQYARLCVGSQAYGLRLSNAQQVRIRNFEVELLSIVHIDSKHDGSAW